MSGLERFHCIHTGICLTTEAPGDYLSDSGVLVFNTGDSEQCHHIQIVDDNYCDPGQFFSNLALMSGAPVITVDPPKAEIVILDSDCGEQTLKSLDTPL